MSTVAGRRRRLAPAIRRDQLLDAAARLIVEQGFLPLPLEQLARRAGVSKGLVYAYFAEQHDLFNALMAREFSALVEAGLDRAARHDSLERAVVDVAMNYFDHVLRHGPLLHILFADLYLAGRHDRRTIRQRDAIARRFGRLARKETRLSVKEIVAAINMMLAIPEEAGKLAFHRETDAGLARDLCRALTLSALAGLRALPKRNSG
jgi:AcrR family transcriptional regulator